MVGVKRVTVTDGSGGLDAGQDGHINVHQNQVDLVLAELIKSRDTRVHDRSQLDGVGKMLVEKSREDAEVDSVVVDDHDLDLAHGLLNKRLLEIAVDALHAHSRGGRGAGRGDTGERRRRRHGVEGL